MLTFGGQDDARRTGEGPMKRLLSAGAAALLLLAVAAVPVGAFRIVARTSNNPLFRDLAVCTNGITFEIAREDQESGSPDIENLMFPPDTLPEPAVVTERLFITTGSDDIFPNPAFDLPDLPGKVLAGSFEADAIANNDPFWDDVQTNGSGYDTTGLRMWVREHTVAWDEPVLAGTELNVYLTDDGGESLIVAAETITVADCEVSPCDFAGAILGTENRDVITGTPGDDIICTFGGNDRVDGGGGDDVVYGGQGKDLLIGGSGEDSLFGEDGKDILVGNDDDDLLEGGQGPDTLYGNGGADVLIGGPGADVLNGGSGPDTEIQ